jgi:cytoskeletal protein CcmA (bactofilin family)
VPASVCVVCERFAPADETPAAFTFAPQSDSGSASAGFIGTGGVNVWACDMRLYPFEMKITDLEAVAAKLIPGRDRRSEQRSAVSIPVKAVISHPSGKSAMVREAVVEELTQQGASLSCMLPVKKRWLVKMTVPLGPAKLELRGRVVRHETRNTEAGVVHVHGIDFVDADAETLDALAIHCGWRTEAGDERVSTHEPPRVPTPPSIISKIPQPLLRTPKEDIRDASVETVSDVSAPGVHFVPDVIVESAPDTNRTPATRFPFHREFPMTTRNTFGVQDRSASDNPLLTVLGGNARIDGRFVIEESIEVQCQISGELQVGGTVVIGERGEVSADISTVNAVIRGRYEGNLKASGSVEIAASGQVSGSIESNELVIAKGAIFTGSVSRVQPAIAEQSETVTVASKTQPAIVFDAERPVQVARAALADLPNTRSPRGQIELT